MKFFLSAVALIVLAGNLVSCQTSAIDDRRITLSFTEDVDLTQDDYIKHLTTRMENTIGNVSDISVDGQTVTLTFKDVVTEIGEEAFSDFPLLASITIPNSVTEIGDGAFVCCESLTSISIPKSVTKIGDGAFAGCESLTSISIPNSVTKIGGGAFLGCESLTSISIPKSVTEIGDRTFAGCESLTSISIPNSVTEIGDGAFTGCSSLRNFSNKFASADGRCLIIDGELTAFAGDGLSNYTIPNSVTEIGNEAFANCSSLTSVTIPNSVTEIGFMAFADCSSLTSITIPNSVTKIDDYAFAGCPLESVTVPRSAEIAENSFEKTTRVIYQ